MTASIDFKNASEQYFEDFKKEILSKNLKFNPEDGAYFVDKFSDFSSKIIDLANFYELKTSDPNEKKEINKQSRIIMSDSRSLYIYF